MPPPRLSDYYNPQAKYCDNPFTDEEDEIPIDALDKIIYDSVQFSQLIFVGEITHVKSLGSGYGQFAGGSAVTYEIKDGVMGGWEGVTVLHNSVPKKFTLGTQKLVFAVRGYDSIHGDLIAEIQQRDEFNPVSVPDQTTISYIKAILPH